MDEKDMGSTKRKMGLPKLTIIAHSQRWIKKGTSKD